MTAERSAAPSGNAPKALRDGSFKVKTRTIIDAIVSMIDQLSDACPEVRSKVFIDAASALLFVTEFDAATFIKRAATNPTMMVKCASREQMLDVIQDIYNFRSRERVPLKHLAETKLRERRDVGSARKLGRGAA